MRYVDIAIFLFALFLASCKSAESDNAAKGEYITEASLLDVSEGDGYTLVKVYDPWNRGKQLDSYVLVPRGTSPDSLPEGTRIEVPLQSAVVYSSVHGTGIAMLGASDAISGVTDAQYFTPLPNDKVVDLGSSLSPSVEKLLTLSPDAILLSPYQNSGFGEIATLGVPIVQMADYMENTPLGRAEWMKLLGLLFGKREKADSIFNAVSRRYNDLRVKVQSSASHRPKVITEQLTSGVWYVPGGNSYMANMLRDAGADYPWSDDKSTGSLQLNIEQVLSVAPDADFWLVRTFGYDETKENMLAASPMYRYIKAFDNDGIYCCNSARTNIFDLIAFRPDSVLSEYVSIFHPSLIDHAPQFFQKVK